MLRSSLPYCLASALAAASLGGCLAADPADLGHGEDAIIGGVPAFSASLDAIGSINKLRDSGKFTQRCTGTLIAPTVVLTAQHCVETEEGDPPLTPDQLEFAIGFDSVAPKRRIKVRGFAAEHSLDEGGFVGLGTDVGVIHLAEPVTDIKPLPFASFDPARVGERFSMVGYGVQDTDDSPSDPFFSKRLTGSATLRGPASGKVLEQMFGSFEGFLRHLGDLRDFDEDEATLRQLFDEITLLDNEEAVLGGAPGDANGCFGDSGGPIIKNVGGKLTTFGVASGVFRGTAQPCFGAVYDVFGPTSRAFIEREVACPLIPAAGTCDGDVAVRCADPNEGAFRPLRNDCATLGQTCGFDPATHAVACVDPS